MNMKTDDIKTEEIDPAVMAELKRLGVNDLPWEHEGHGRYSLTAWNASCTVWALDNGGVMWVPNNVPADLPGRPKEAFCQLARARYSPQIRTSQAEPTALERLDDIKPSNCSWQVEKIKAQLPQLTGGTASAVSVICGQTLERSEVTGADYREALQRIRSLVLPEINNPKTRSEPPETPQEALGPITETSEPSEDFRGDSGASEAVEGKCLNRDLGRLALAEALEILREEWSAWAKDDGRVGFLEKDWLNVIELIEEAMER